jgi:hypothetical protein
VCRVVVRDPRTERPSEPPAALKLVRRAPQRGGSPRLSSRSTALRRLPNEDRDEQRNGPDRGPVEVDRELTARTARGRSRSQDADTSDKPAMLQETVEAFTDLRAMFDELTEEQASRVWLGLWACETSWFTRTGPRPFAGVRPRFRQRPRVSTPHVTFARPAPSGGRDIRASETARGRRHDHATPDGLETTQARCGRVRTAPRQSIARRGGFSFRRSAGSILRALARQRPDWSKTTIARRHGTSNTRTWRVSSRCSSTARAGQSCSWKDQPSPGTTGWRPSEPHIRMKASDSWTGDNS